jgi:hypothetical protein
MCVSYKNIGWNLAHEAECFIYLDIYKGRCDWGTFQADWLLNIAAQLS